MLSQLNGLHSVSFSAIDEITASLEVMKDCSINQRG